MAKNHRINHHGWRWSQIGQNHLKLLSTIAGNFYYNIANG